MIFLSVNEKSSGMQCEARKDVMFVCVRKNGATMFTANPSMTTKSCNAHRTRPCPGGRRPCAVRAQAATKRNSAMRAARLRQWRRPSRESGLAQPAPDPTHHGRQIRRGRAIIRVTCTNLVPLKMGPSWFGQRTEHVRAHEHGGAQGAQRRGTDECKQSIRTCITTRKRNRMCALLRAS